MFMGTWALIRPIRNIFSPVSGWNALSYKYLHLHNSSSVIFNSARLSPFLNNIIQFDNHILWHTNQSSYNGQIVLITCIWWPRLVHTPAVSRWQTNSKDSLQLESEAPYPCTCSDPNTVCRCRFSSTFCQLLLLLLPLVPSPTGCSLTPVPSVSSATRPRTPTTRSYQVFCHQRPLARCARF